MDPFPFTRADWKRVKDAAYPVMTATLADDNAVAKSTFIALQETLHELRRKYGNHPVLLETEADFCGDLDDAIRLYTEALRIAQEHSLPTVSICLSYARASIGNDRYADEALAVLRSCREQVYGTGDESNVQEYEELETLLDYRRSGDSG